MVKQKKGQMKLSFGMIFSIILIIAFLGFAFLAIQKFFDFQKGVTEEKFYQNLNNDIDSVWKSTSASKQVEYLTPRGATKVCFENDPYQNVYFYSDHPMPGRLVSHLEVTQDSCIKIINEKVRFILEKTSDNPLVKVKKAI